MSHNQIIKALGQTELARRWPGEDSMTVHARIAGWMRRNHIPSRHWTTLAGIADEMGYELSYDDLVEGIDYS